MKKIIMIIIAISCSILYSQYYALDKWHLVEKVDPITDDKEISIFIKKREDRSMNFNTFMIKVNSNSININLYTPSLAFKKDFNITNNNIDIIYTGSARVWRRSKSEMGTRRCLAIDIQNGSIKKTFINIKNAGEYRVYETNIYSLSSLDKKAEEWNINDIIDINVYGIAEDENEVEEKINAVRNKYSKYVREINVKTTKLFLLENAYNESIIKEFLSIAEGYELDTLNDEDLEIVELAKRIGIEKIYAALQSKK